jgi:hypothetical protein
MRELYSEDNGNRSDPLRSVPGEDDVSFPPDNPLRTLAYHPNDPIDQMAGIVESLTLIVPSVLIS